MRRRDFLALATAATATAVLPCAGFAQQPKTPRIVLLAVTLPPHVEAAFKDGLKDYGWVDGRNMTLQMVTAPSYADLDRLATDSIATNPDVILAWGVTAVGLARQQTSKIPIILGGPAGDLIGSVTMQSWARPGENVTGVTLIAPDLLNQQMAMLKEMVPSARRVVMLNLPKIPVTQAKLAEALPLASSMGFDATTVDFSDTEDLAPQFARLVAAKPDVIYVPATSYFDVHRDALYDLLLENRLVALSSSVEPGLPTPFPGAVSYGYDADEVIRRSGYFVDALLKGAKPADLPIEFEQPTVFDLGVNTWAAKMIGFTVPRDILARATSVIDYDLRATR